MAASIGRTITMAIRTKNADGGAKKHRMPMTFAAMENERTVMGMAEYIACRRCDSPDCKGCNLKRLETMLENGKFDCLMNENRAINTSADVAPAVHGRWEEKGYVCGESEFECSVCHKTEWRTSISRFRWCPFCGARMDGDIDAKAD